MRLVYEDHVWAVLGAVDGPSAHLAEQMVAKARLPLVSAVSTDASVQLAGVPWMFSLAPDDERWAEALVAPLEEKVPRGDLLLIAATDHDSRLAAEALSEALTIRQRNIGSRWDLDPDIPWEADRLEIFLERSPAAVFVLAAPELSADLVNALRQGGFEGPIYGGPAMARRGFAERLAAPPGRIQIPQLLGAGEDRDAFESAFVAEAGHRPDWAAYQAYDAARLVVASTIRAGLDRGRIRDTLAKTTSWQGVSGEIVWDPTGQNLRPVGVVAWTAEALSLSSKPFSR